VSEPREQIALVAVPLPDGRWLALAPDALRAALDAAQRLGIGGAAPASSNDGVSARRGTIPSIRCGKALRFEPSAAKAALRERRTGTNA